MVIALTPTSFVVIARPRTAKNLPDTPLSSPPGSRSTVDHNRRARGGQEEEGAGGEASMPPRFSFRVRSAEGAEGERGRTPLRPLPGVIPPSKGWGVGPLKKPTAATRACGQGGGSPAFKIKTTQQRPDQQLCARRVFVPS